MKRSMTGSVPTCGKCSGTGSKRLRFQPTSFAHSPLPASRCEQTWREARANNDWATVRPLLETVVALSRTRADALADKLELERYDALLDGYEPQLRSADVSQVFDDLKDFLLPLIDPIIEAAPPCLPIPGPFSTERQRSLCEATMKLLGFDFSRGRFDVSHHPFCGGVPDDTRITTRYRDDVFLESFMAICHETGHALYQQGLPAAWRDQPVGDALGCCCSRKPVSADGTAGVPIARSSSVRLHP